MAYPFGLIGKDGQGYAIEASGDDKLSIYVIFSNLLVKIIESNGEETKGNMRQLAILYTKVGLENGDT